MILIGAFEHGVQAVLFGKLQCVPQLRIAEYLVSDETYLPNPHFCTFVHYKPHTHAGRRNRLGFGTNGSKRFPILYHQVLQRTFGSPQLCRVILAVYGKSYFFLFKGIEDVGFGKGMIADVFDRSGSTAFL